MSKTDKEIHADLRAALNSAGFESMQGTLKEAVVHLLDHIERLEERVKQLEGGSTSASFPETVKDGPPPYR